MLTLKMYFLVGGPDFSKKAVSERLHKYYNFEVSNMGYLVLKDIVKGSKAADGYKDDCKPDT